MLAAAICAALAITITTSSAPIRSQKGMVASRALDGGAVGVPGRAASRPATAQR
jgi:hypothetical protein